MGLSDPGASSFLRDFRERGSRSASDPLRGWRFVRVFHAGPCRQLLPRRAPPDGAGIAGGPGHRHLQFALSPAARSGGCRLRGGEVGRVSPMTWATRGLSDPQLSHLRNGARPPVSRRGCRGHWARHWMGSTSLAELQPLSVNTLSADKQSIVTLV